MFRKLQQVPQINRMDQIDPRGICRVNLHALDNKLTDVFNVIHRTHVIAYSPTLREIRGLS